MMINYQIKDAVERILAAHPDCYHELLAREFQRLEKSYGVAIGNKMLYAIWVRTGMPRV